MRNLTLICVAMLPLTCQQHNINEYPDGVHVPVIVPRDTDKGDCPPILEEEPLGNI
jgi:hypothetical protein